MQLIDPQEVAEFVARNKERLRNSRRSNQSCCDSVRQSREAITRSRALLSRNDVNLVQVPMVPERAAPAAERLPVDGRAAGGRAGVPGKTESRAGGPMDLMETLRERVLTDTRVSLDGRRFVDCTVQNCTLEFNGGPVEIESTRFVDCRFEFGAEAALTVRFLECFGFFEGAAPEYGLGPVRSTPPGFVN